jgi:hypothetical protein
VTAVAGPTLKAALVKLAQDVVNPCLMLVKEMVGSIRSWLSIGCPACTLCVPSSLHETDTVVGVVSAYASYSTHAGKVFAAAGKWRERTLQQLFFSILFGGDSCQAMVPIV